MNEEQIKELWEDLKDICNIESMDTGRANAIANVFGELSSTISKQHEALEWYANERNYRQSEEEYFEGYPPEVINDRGYKARKVLGDHK